ncbi:hypothetical protein GCM10009550_41390 [Actinocorallia libanotica]|uniref:Uncharacterized protein n=1 Tax=Actinocorallia libanotica TaxID=46162 RepID=A0ABN1REX3_9ACTN
MGKGPGQGVGQISDAGRSSGGLQRREDRTGGPHRHLDGRRLVRVDRNRARTDDPVPASSESAVGDDDETFPERITSVQVGEYLTQPAGIDLPEHLVVRPPSEGGRRTGTDRAEPCEQAEGGGTVLPALQIRSGGGDQATQPPLTHTRIRPTRNYRIKRGNEIRAGHDERGPHLRTVPEPSERLRGTVEVARLGQIKVGGQHRGQTWRGCTGPEQADARPPIALN